MRESYVVDYVNENEFHKLERSLKKYNMLAYKKLYFEYYPKIKEGIFYAYFYYAHFSRIA